MIVNIKRFDIFGRKINKKIKYPLAFNFKEYTDAFIDSKGTKGQNEVYDLYGIVIHSGYSADSGHYYAFCKESNGQRWYECNDSHVSQLRSE